MMVLCMQLDENLGDQLIQIAVSKSVDGVLYFPYHNNCQHADRLIKNNMPFVLLDWWIKGVVADCVRCDDEQGGYLAGAHLAALGHRKYLFLFGVLASSSQLDRYQGFIRALGDAQIPPENVRRVPWESIEDSIETGSISSLLEPLDYTGVVSFSDEIAYYALNGYLELGIRVPEDVSIISFDCIRSGFPYLPRMTSIYTSESTVGEEAVRLLLARLQNKELPIQQIVLPVRITDDTTTAVPRVM